MDASYKKATNSSFEIKRVFTAPLDRVWKAWSETDQFAKWWVQRDAPLRSRF
jgi:uncharacterized protein YndB with AHSA1/START domain